jgi:hypothetical protein
MKDNLTHWVYEHASGVVEKVLATLLVTFIVYLLCFVPKVGPVLTNPLPLPLWLLLFIPLAAVSIVVLYRRSQDKKRRENALSFEKIVRELDKQRSNSTT